MTTHVNLAGHYLVIAHTGDFEVDYRGVYDTEAKARSVARAAKRAGLKMPHWYVGRIIAPIAWPEVMDYMDALAALALLPVPRRKEPS